MSKKYTLKKKLIIVESPSKCAKIIEYLGSGYKCIACFGHLRELNSLENIDIENNFQPTYTFISNINKKKQIEIIRKEIKDAEEIILATDNDREGEAIAWHICEIFHLNVEKTKRILFNEITEKAIKFAIQNPVKINMNIVNAQKSRQILDLLVGYKITPVLWKYIVSDNKKEGSLSAGRCQSPALKIIYENQMEINNLSEETLYHIKGIFTNINLEFELNTIFFKEEEVLQFLQSSLLFSHVFHSNKEKKIWKSAPEALTTSKIQQCCSNEFHMSPKETIEICQNLYEAGYITYMRTDCNKYSKEFLEETKEYILRNYKEEYLHENIHLLEKNHDNNSPHEAIRPTNISLKELPNEIGKKERKIYQFIREHTLESCMSKASYNSLTCIIIAAQEKEFHYTCEKIDFPGWQIVKNKSNTDNKGYSYLLNLKQNQVLSCKKIFTKLMMRENKLHYSEAKLVHLLEEKGIGRPSTFSSIIEKIQERGYVKKTNIKGKEMGCKEFELVNNKITELIIKREFGNESKKLEIQPIGIKVIEFLDKFFTDIVKYEFTFQMEQELDEISNGNKIWYELCDTCHTKLNYLIHKLNSSLTFSLNDPLITMREKSNENDSIDKNDYKMKNQVNKNEFILGTWNNNNIILKKGKYGLYMVCGEITKTLKNLGNRPIENIRLEDILPVLQQDSNIIRNISENISIRKNSKGNDYIFFKMKTMKKPQFYSIEEFHSDYKTCDEYAIKHWIKENYDIF
jgi:DNA topoisomerase-1